MRIELFLALRLLREGRTQSVLIASGAAVGIAVLIFLTALIAGLQRDLIARTVGSQAHLSVAPAEVRPRGLWQAQVAPGTTVVTRVDLGEQRVRVLDQPRALTTRLARVPGIRAVAPVCEGAATARRGAAQTNVMIVGVDADSYGAVVDVRARMVAGEFEITARSAVIGAGIAESLNLRLGDRVRIQRGADAGAAFTVRGIVRFGVQRLDETRIFVTLSEAQALLDLPGALTGIEASVDQIFDADAVAQTVRGQTGLEVDSWMTRNAELLTGLRSQSSSSTLIQVFVLLAVSIGIASVLVVSVVQKRREIGILRAMGLSQRRTQRIFLIEGALLGLAGAALGACLGAALVVAFQHFAIRADGTRLFPIELSATLFATAGAVATLTGLVSAVFPARHAAMLDPAVAIRNE